MFSCYSVEKSNEYFIIAAWSLSNWFSSHTGFLPDVQLSSEGISQLISDLGLTKFLSDDKCVYRMISSGTNSPQTEVSR